MSNERFIPTEGIHNFRDYGGYETAGGGKVKRGHLYRSGQHFAATPDDLAQVDALGLANVVDLRGESERKAHPCKRSVNFVARIHAYDGETAYLAPHIEASDGMLDQHGAREALTRIYRDLPRRTAVLWGLRRYFEVLDAGEGASLVNCHAGKDRTGMAVALVQHALGVHPDDAMNEFLLTNSAPNNEARIADGYAAVKGKYRTADDETVRVLMGVEPGYLEAMRKSLIVEAGSIDAFLENVLGVGAARKDRLRARYVE